MDKWVDRSGLTPYSNQNSYRRKHIVSLELKETGQYHNQYVRPWNLKANNSSLNYLRDVIDETKADVLAEGHISNVAPSMINVSSKTEGDVYIPNSFKSRRFSFTLIIEYEKNDGSVLRENIFGYTEALEVSHGRHIPEDMLFYINSYIEQLQTKSPLQPNFIIDNNAVIASDNNVYATDGKLEYLIRPEDLLSHIPNQALIAGFNNENDTIRNLSSTVSDIPNLSSKLDNSPTTYLSRILNNYRSSVGDVTDHYDDLEDVGTCIYNNACAKVSTKHLLSEQFFLSSLRNLGNVGYTNKFCLYDIFDMFPEFKKQPDRLKVLLLGDKLKGISNYLDNSIQLGGSDKATLSAVSIASTINSIMTRHGIVNIDFKATNIDQFNTLGTPSIIVIKINLLSNDSFHDGTLNAIKSLIARDIVGYISENNMFPVNLEVSSSINGDTQVNLSINGERPELFVVPTFCNSLFSPVITTNESRLPSTASNIDMLCREVNKDVISKINKYGMDNTINNASVSGSYDDGYNVSLANLKDHVKPSEHRNSIIDGWFNN